MLTQTRLILIQRLTFKLPPVLGLQVLLNLVEVLDSCTGPGGSVDVPAGVVCSDWISMSGSPLVAR